MVGACGASKLLSCGPDWLRSDSREVCKARASLVRLSLALSLTVAGCTDQSTEPIAGEAPTTQITSAPSADTHDRFAWIEFEGERSASFECRLNGGEWAQCERPLVLTNLNMGTQTVRVRGVSSQGQTDPSPRHGTRRAARGLAPLQGKPERTP